MNNASPVIILLLPKTSYRNQDFLAAAGALGMDVLAVQNNCHVLAESWNGAPLLSLPFDDPKVLVETVRRHVADSKVAAVIGVDDSGAAIAQQLAQALGVAANNPAAAQTLGNKWRFRQLQYRLRLPAPNTVRVAADTDITESPVGAYPLVAKPLRLSASQGVIRVDHPGQLPAVLQRIRHILRAQNVPPDERTLLLEDFIAGKEYALEAVMHHGKLHTLALFEKPEPLDGPFFAETVYVTPPDLELAQQQEFSRQVELLCREAGWLNGPVHAEARVEPGRVTMLEIAPRTIGGLCSRLLIPLLGRSLESLVLDQALGRFEPLETASGAAGVYMIPVPHPGLFESVEGLEQAQNIPGITGITITASVDEPLEPLPEGNKYVGFVFAAADDATKVKSALAQAQGCLQVRLRRMLAPASSVQSVA